MNITSEEMLNRFVRAIPLKRLIKPEEVAELILFLASEKGNSVTGQSWNIDGGLEVH